MNSELEKAKSYTENKQYEKALEVLLTLENNENPDALSYIEVLKEIYSNYKELGNLKEALDYYKKYNAEEFKKLTAENKEKTEKLNSALKIHSAHKETELLQEKNDELHNANIELNQLRDIKNELIRTVSEELKLPIVTIEGITMNYYKAMSEDKEINPAEMKSDLESIESLSQQVLKNVNFILEKNKEEHTE